MSCYDLTIPQLKTICKTYRIRNYSGLRKSELIEHIQSQMDDRILNSAIRNFTNTYENELSDMFESMVVDPYSRSAMDVDDSELDTLFQAMTIDSSNNEYMPKDFDFYIGTSKTKFTVTRQEVLDSIREDSKYVNFDNYNKVTRTTLFMFKLIRRCCQKIGFDLFLQGGSQNFMKINDFILADHIATNGLNVLNDKFSTVTNQRIDIEIIGTQRPESFENIIERYSITPLGEYEDVDDNSTKCIMERQCNRYITSFLYHIVGRINKYSTYHFKLTNVEIISG